MRYRVNNGQFQNGTYDCVVNIRNGRVVRMSYDPPAGQYSNSDRDTNSGIYDDRRERRMRRNNGDWNDRNGQNDRNDGSWNDRNDGLTRNRAVPRCAEEMAENAPLK
ncbi:MAG: hypothetical protein WKF37_08090 [Bryobacteraceae bacterium]